MQRVASLKPSGIVALQLDATVGEAEQGNVLWQHASTGHIEKKHPTWKLEH